MEHLLAIIGGSVMQSLATLSTIDTRLHAGWTDGEEERLLKSNVSYRELAQEIDHCRARLEPAALDGPFQDAQRDPEYLRAREATHKALTSCDLALAAVLKRET